MVWVVYTFDYPLYLKVAAILNRIVGSYKYIILGTLARLSPHPCKSLKPAALGDRKNQNYILAGSERLVDTFSRSISGRPHVVQVTFFKAFIVL